jgi:outer membrane immunogenic protein
VFGIETDLQASAQHVSTTAADPFRAQFGPAVLVNPLVVTTAVASGTTTTHYQGRIAWFGTVRGRLGVASDRLLIYGTGGLAYGRVSLDASMSTSGSTFTTACIAGVCNPPDGPFGFAQAATLSGGKVNYGWTAGGGFEWAAARNLSFKAEYIYLDLGSVDVSSIVGVGVGRPAAMHARFNDHVVRIGFNYRFADQAGMSP